VDETLRKPALDVQDIDSRDRARRSPIARALSRLGFFPAEWSGRPARVVRDDHSRDGIRTSSQPFRQSASRDKRASNDRPTPRMSLVEIGRQPARAAQRAALRDALALVDRIPAAGARLRQANYRTPLQKLREAERARRSGSGPIA